MGRVDLLRRGVGEYAPIALFVYNRLDKTQLTITALKNNILASDSDLYIFSDGPKCPDDARIIEELRAYLKTVNGFHAVIIKESDSNKGLASSIVGGVTDVIARHGFVIVLEDDIVTSPFFLKFMNDALDLYHTEEKVMSISGYMYPHKEKLPSTFFLNMPASWGWATWKRAWELYDASVDSHIEYLNKNNLWREFNKVGGKYLERQLLKNRDGRLKTWFVYWHASVFRHNGFCLYPGVSLVNNVGFDGSGEHEAYTNSYYSPVADRPITVDEQPLEENALAKNIICNFFLIRENFYIRGLRRVIMRFLSSIKRRRA